MAKPKFSILNSLILKKPSFNLKKAYCSILIPIAIIFPAQTKAESSVDGEAPTPPDTFEQEIGFKGVGGYTHPLRFAPEDNGLSIDNPQLKWTFETDDIINFDSIKIDGQNIKFTFSQYPRPKSLLGGDEEKSVTNIAMDWPEYMAKKGQLLIETLEGKVRYRKRFSESDFETWQKDVRNSDDKNLKSFRKTTFGVLDVPRKALAFLWRGGKFKICMTSENSKEERLKICSVPFETASSRGKLLVKTPEPTGQGEVFFEKKPIGKAGLASLKPGKPIALKITFKSGSYIQFSTRPQDLGILDVVESRDGKEIILTGHGAKPLGRVEYISKPITHFWAPTGILQDQIWRIAIQRDFPTLKVLGAFGFPFTMLFTYDRLPKESDRIYIRHTRSSGTYSSAPVIYGLLPKGAVAISEEYRAKMIGSREFEWTFSSPKSGDFNRSSLILKKPGNEKPWVAHHKMFRSYPFEASGRLAGILSQDSSLILLGEISTGAWFESIGFTQNTLISKQRWGLTARYFKSLSSIASQSGTQIQDFAVFNSDLKYNLLPGIWHRDELVGLMATIQQIQLAGTSPTLWGAGAYWARTMPKVFDQLFNLIPFMEYPKYVDMELIYFPLSLTNGVSPGSSFNLNFHGRIFWQERFYGEVGFGMKRFDYTLTQGGNRAISLNTVYGAAGLGFLF